MPYIDKRDRFNKLNISLRDLVEYPSHYSLSAGDLNFIISSILWAQFNYSKSYATANELIGVLECVKQEMYRRLIGLYEDEKIIQNGDLEISA